MPMILIWNNLDQVKTQNQKIGKLND